MDMIAEILQTDKAAAGKLEKAENTFYLLAFYKEVIKRQFIKLLKSAQAHIGIEILSLEKRLHKASMDGIRVNVTESVFISG